jgi:hypothetical protein
MSPEDIPEIPFTPVQLDRARHNGWSPAQQQRFIKALAVIGSVGAAAKAVGMNRASAYRLLDRPGSESFAAAWETALHMGRMRMYSYALDRAINGVTIVRVLKGGAVDVSGGPDMPMVRAALRGEEPVAKATKATF